MSALRCCAATLLACAALVAPANAQATQASPSNDVLMRAMRDEMARSIQQLRLDTLPKPYFIAYRVTESEGVTTSANLGSIASTGTSRGARFLQLELRVGDYTFDNTNFIGAGFMPSGFVGMGPLPLDDDYQEIRRQLWLSTDMAYKQAVEALAQKKAALEARSRTDSLADFTKEPVTNTSDDMPRPAPPNRQAMEALVKELSATFRSSPEIYISSVNATVSWSRTTYLNSEGTSFTRSRARAGVGAQASSQALDGTTFSMSYSASGNYLSELPNRDSLMKGVKDLASRVIAHRSVPVADTYDGPVLFEGAAAAELFSAIIGNRMVGSRRAVTSSQFGGMGGMGGGNEWEDLVGSQVLPRWMTVVDDPTLKSMGGKPVDYYIVDEDGVKTRATTIIERGVLKQLLTSRTPVVGSDRSTGNRFGFGTRPLHLTITADSAISDADMRAKLLALATAQGKPFAVVVKQLNTAGSAGNDPESIMAIMMNQQRNAGGPVARAMRAVKVFPDGREEPMRAADIYGITAQTFKEITAASSQPAIHSDVLGSGAGLLAGLGSGQVTFQMPALLFPSVTIRKPRGTTPKLPVVAPPQ